MKALRIKDIEPDMAAKGSGTSLNVPEVIWVRVPDDFNGNVRGYVSRKCGFPVYSLSMEVLDIIDTTDGLLEKYCTGKENIKKVFKKDGDLSAAGNEVLKRIEEDVKRRHALEMKDVKEKDMPKDLTELLLAVQAITGNTWEDKTEVNTVMGWIVAELLKKRPVDIIDKYAALSDDRDRDTEDEDDEEDDDE